MLFRSPLRHEGYFLLSRYHERESNWQECYTYACIGLSFREFTSLPIDVDYKGWYCLRFEKAVSAYWIGRIDESIEIFKNLIDTPNIAPEYLNSIKDNLTRLNVAF